MSCQFAQWAAGGLVLVALAAATAADAPRTEAKPAPAAKAEPKAPAAPAKPAEVKQVAWQKDMKAAWAETKTSQRPLLVFIVSEGCVYCERMEAQGFHDQRVARTISESFIANRLQAEQNQSFVQKLNIRIYPATVIIAPDAHVIDQINGYLPPAQLQERLAAAAAKKLK